jgi:hypothetical protein
MILSAEGTSKLVYNPSPTSHNSLECCRQLFVNKLYVLTEPVENQYQLRHPTIIFYLFRIEPLSVVLKKDRGALVMVSWRLTLQKISEPYEEQHEPQDSFQEALMCP